MQGMGLKISAVRLVNVECVVHEKGRKHSSGAQRVKVKKFIYAIK